MPKEFRFKEKLMHKLSELSPVDKFLIERAQRLIAETGIENELKKGGNYLDVGVGKGHIVQQLLPRVQTRVINENNEEERMGSYSCIDVADKPLKKVQKRERKRLEEAGVLKNEKNPMDFSWASGNALPYKSQSMDGISFFFSIHHMDKEDLDEVISEAKRVLKPDGLIFIAEDIVETDEQKEITEERDRKVNWENKDKEHSYKSNPEWKKYFEENGLELVRSTFFQTDDKKGTVQHGFYVLKLK